jgi:hypothetical protein
MAEISKDRKTFLKKWAKLREIMAGFEWEKDGKNPHQRYKYIKESQYKKNFEQALQEAGLLWKMETLDTIFHGAISDKMHLIEAKFRGRLIDPDTGEFEEFLFHGTGADNGDKALYKAVTGGHKFLLASNFNVAAGNDPEDDEEVEGSKRPASPEKREEIKEELTNGDSKATKMQINALKKQLSLLREIDPQQEEFITNLAIRTDNFSPDKLTKKTCEALLIKIGEMIDAAKEG